MRALFKRSRTFAIHPITLVAALTCSIAATLPNLSEGAVWKATESWSPKWEGFYSDWVRQNWDTDFFTRPGTPYSQLKVDCADTVYSMRAIYAFENNLPFAIKDPTGGQTPISNEMARFDRIPEKDGKRMRAFLGFLYGIAGTSSIPFDTYPVKPDRSGIQPGTLLLTDKLSHHSWTIKDITPEGLPHLIFSSRPAKTTILSRLGFPTMGFVFPKGVDESRHAGFRAFRLPEDIGKPVWEVTGYSREQYEIPAKNWRETIQSRLATRIENPNDQIQRLWNEACTNVKERVIAVDEGLAYLSSYQKDCLDPKSYDDYSTPNRDLRLKGSFEDLDSAIESAIENRHPLTEATLALIAETRGEHGGTNVHETGGQTPSAQCSVTLQNGLAMTFAEVRSRSLQDRLSSNPHDSLQSRWGTESTPGARAARCPAY